MDIKANDIYKTINSAFRKYVYSESAYTLSLLSAVHVLSEIDAVYVKPILECGVSPV